MDHDTAFPLTDDNRKKGTHLFNQSSFFNGFSFAFLGDSIVQLIALSYGASNLQVGYLASAIHISGFVVLIIPLLFAGRKIVNIYFVFWLLRGLVSIGYVFVLFLDGQAAVMLVLFVYTLFSLSRNLGIGMDAPLKQILFPTKKRGKRLSRNLFWFQSSRFVGRLISYVIIELHFFTSIVGLLFIQFLGAIFNSATALLIKRIPVEDRVEKTSLKKIFIVFTEIIRKPERLLVIFITLIMIVVFIIISMIVAFQNKVLFHSETQVLLVLFFASIGQIAATVIAPKFIDKIKSIPVLISLFLVQIVLMMTLAFIPVDTHFVFISAIVVIMYLVHSILFIISSKLLLGIMPIDSKIGFSSIVNFMTAIAALVFGAAAGGLADISEYMKINTISLGTILSGITDGVKTDISEYAHINVFHIYTFSFVLGAVLCCAGIVVTLLLSHQNKKRKIEM